MATTAVGSQWVTSYFCPALGTVICNIMWLSPLDAVRTAWNDREIKDVNPAPFVITILNCIGWTMYGCMKSDYFIFFSNCTGLVLGFYYSLTSFQLLAMSKTPAHLSLLTALNNIVISGVAYWCLASLIAFIVLYPSPTGQQAAFLLIGISSDICSLSYYAAPLSTVYTVVRTCNSSTLHPPLILTNLVNALMWVIYGAIALNDPMVYVPNAIGFSFALVQLALIVLLPRRSPTGGATHKEKADLEQGGQKTLAPGDVGIQYQQSFRNIVASDSKIEIAKKEMERTQDL